MLCIYFLYIYIYMLYIYIFFIYIYIRTHTDIYIYIHAVPHPHHSTEGEGGSTTPPPHHRGGTLDHIYTYNPQKSSEVTGQPHHVYAWGLRNHDAARERGTSHQVMNELSALMSVMVEGADQVPWDHDPFWWKPPMGPEILGNLGKFSGWSSRFVGCPILRQRKW